MFSFVHFRPRDVTSENCFFHMSSCAGVFQIPRKTSRGLNWGKVNIQAKKGLFGGHYQRAKIGIMGFLRKTSGPVHSRKMTFPDYDLEGLRY